MLHEHHFRAMNTGVGVWLWSTARDRAAAVRHALLRAEEFFACVEDELSRFHRDSSLSRLNDAAGAGWQAVSPLLWTVLTTAVDAAEDSGGIYDPTLLRALEAIGYDRTFEAVDAGGTITTVPAVSSFGSWRRVRFDNATRCVSLPADLAVDLGGIGKGWTVDRVALSLASLGPVLVDAGGDLRVIGTVDGESWPVAVQDPFEPASDRGVVRLRDGALATSSIGGRRWRRGDRVYHHVLDPRTGMPAESDLYTVTVRAPSASMGDVASKVALVLGSGPGATYLVNRGLSGLLTTIEGREVAVGAFRLEDVDCHASPHCA